MPPPPSDTVSPCSLAGGEIAVLVAEQVGVEAAEHPQLSGPGRRAGALPESAASASPTLTSSSSREIAARPALHVPQRKSRPVGEVPLGGRAEAAQIASRELRQRRIAVEPSAACRASPRAARGSWTAAVGAEAGDARGDRAARRCGRGSGVELDPGRRAACSADLGPGQRPSCSEHPDHLRSALLLDRGPASRAARAGAATTSRSRARTAAASSRRPRLAIR